MQCFILFSTDLMSVLTEYLQRTADAGIREYTAAQEFDRAVNRASVSLGTRTHLLAEARGRLKWVS